MDAEQVKEWVSFDERAQEIDRKGNAPNARGIKRLFQIVISPSFEPVIGWEVCQKDFPFKKMLLRPNRAPELKQLIVNHDS